MLDWRLKREGKREKGQGNKGISPFPPSLFPAPFSLLPLISCLLCLAFCFFSLDAFGEGEGTRDKGTRGFSSLLPSPSEVRIKDIARIHGIYDIQLHGYGLVVGLNGTGDSAGATFTVQSVINMIRRFGIDLPRDRMSLRNIAAVMVTADLPFFAKVGGRIDVLVSSMGDAKSIAGGTLLPTPLCASDSGWDKPIPYVLAQGPVLVGGFSASAGMGNSVQKNHPTVGRVPNGGVIQKETRLGSPSTRKDLESYKSYESFILSLDDPDFTTAMRVVSAINDEFQITGGDACATAVDASSVKVTAPASYSATRDYVTFISRLENLMVVPDQEASVVIDERTGTIVVGKDVRITPVAIEHGNLSIQIKTEEEVSQPPPLSAGETVIVSKKDLAVEEEKPKMQVIRGGASIDEVVKALNRLGVTPRDMIIIFQAIKKAGALHAKLVIM